jgi:PAS domain S-box-containing protein
VVGALCFGHERPGAFGAREERAVVALGQLAGAAIDSARLLRTLEAREAELAALAHRDRLINQATREGLWYWDVPANTVEWNDALVAALGVSRDTWGGTFDDWFSRLHPADQPRLAAALKAHLEQRVPYQIELFRLRHADGGYRWFTTTGQAEWGPDGKPVRMAGSVREVTDRKLAEDALRASEHRYAQMFDSLQDMVFCKSADLTLIYANAATCRYYQMTAAQLRDLTDIPYDQIDFTQDENGDDRAVFETGQVVEREFEPKVSPSGEVRYFHTVKSPVFDQAGKVVELVGVSRDVTDRWRDMEAQKALALATEILSRSIDYQTTLANVAKAMVPAAADWCAIDLVDEGRIRRIAVEHPDPSKVELAYELERRYPPPDDAASGARAVIKSGKPELVSHIPDELLEAGARDAEHLRILRALELHSYIVVPMKAHDRVLGAITLVTEGSRLFDEDDLRFALELSRRASAALENALLYEALREINANLEQRVSERTTALSEANKELEAFSYTVSHDLRAPIRHISAFADLLRSHARDKLDDKSHHYVDTIKLAARQMAALVDGLLTFSRLGRAELTARRVALHDLVAGIRRELELEAKDRTIAWDVRELPIVAGDPTMLRVVLANLLGNAVKYTRKRPDARIELGAEHRDSELVVWVKDNGAGFNMEYAHKLFGVFQRLHSDQDFEGTGIGLATARRIVHRHGGRIWGEGHEGQGAAFYFTLPLPHSESTP